MESDDQNTYNIVPDNIMEDNDVPIKHGDRIDKEKKSLKDYFDTHIGFENAKKGEDIAKQLGFKTTGHNVKFRFLVTKIIIEDLYPIVSCKDGYYKATKKGEILHNIDTEIKRISGVQKRIDALVQISKTYSEGN